MSSHQIGHTVFYHSWQQTTAVLHLAKCQMTSNLKTSCQIFHAEQRVWCWMFHSSSFICCWLFCFFGGGFLGHVIDHPESMHICIHVTMRTMWADWVKDLYSRTCQSLWSSNMLLGMFFSSSHWPIAPQWQLIFPVWHEDTLLYLSIACSFSVDLTLCLRHAVCQSLKSKSFCQTTSGQLDQTV